MDEYFTIAQLRESYQANKVHPESHIRHCHQRAQEDEDSCWIHVLSESELETHIQNLGSKNPAETPLWGIPFAIKDNIDLKSSPTTAGCPAFSRVATRSATVVDKLIQAGAIPIGKTNLDQFATGLVGTRSPYGIVPNAIDPEYIAGGSSSGSAVVVRKGIVPFALGTDTAGSGRIPAAFQGIVGFKPTRGWWSTSGVVPACQSLDCVSVFSTTVADAELITQVVSGFDNQDPYAREVTQEAFESEQPRYGFLALEDVSLLDPTYADLYHQFVSTVVPQAQAIEPSLFLEAGELLYQGPWVAERLTVVADYIESNSEDVNPVVRQVLANGTKHTAQDYFEAEHRLVKLRRQVQEIFQDIDVLIAPTAPKHFRIEEVLADPLGTNTELGRFTNNVNLLDLCAVALPADETCTGLPFGITLLTTQSHDLALLRLAKTVEARDSANPLVN